MFLEHPRAFVAASMLALTLALAGRGGKTLASSGPAEKIEAFVLGPASPDPDGSLHFMVVKDGHPSAAMPAALQRIFTPIFDDSFTPARKPEWQVIRGAATAAEGRLVASGTRDLVVVGGLKATDVRVSVDARADAQMGIVLRYQNPGNFVLAFFTPGARIIGFHQSIDGNLGPWLGATSAAGLSGRSLHVVAETDGPLATLTVSDDQGHRALARTRLTRILGAGSVGLYHDASVPGPQQFAEFSATRIERPLPAGAIEVIVPPGKDAEDQAWSLGQRVSISGTLSTAEQYGRRRAVIRVSGPRDIIPLSDPARQGTLFPVHNPGRQWHRFVAEGYGQEPVCGVIYRAGDPVTNGMPLGGVDTGCLDLETSGMLGYATIFNTHVPRRGPLNVPILGLSVGGKTWLLCDPQPKDGAGGYQPTASGQKYSLWRNGKYEQTADLLTPVPMDLKLDGVETAREIHYWGHYPVADLEFETGAPVEVGLRAWSPFLPGDLVDSTRPAAVFEVHLRNATGAVQKGTLAFTFPGPLDREAGSSRFQRLPIEGAFRGVEVVAPLASYALGVIGRETPRLGGELGSDAGAWSKIARELPASDPTRAGTSAAVDFALAPGEARVVRFALAWFAPDWNAGGYNWAGAPHTFTHMYAKHHPGARQTAEALARDHDSLLRRVLAWQQVIYRERSLPVWLRDSLVNNLHLIAETGMWAQARPPLPAWVKPEDGLFGMNECPRGCPQIECIPCSFYGNQPLVYFFPKLALATLRGYKGYQYPDGAAVWVFGGCTGQTPPIDLANPTKGYQFATNGISLAAMVDRYWLCHGKNEPGFVKEFLPIVKQNMTYTVGMRPSYGEGDGIIAMPTGNVGTEWFEAPEPGWRGMTAHVGGLHLAQLRIAQRLARLAGDAPFETQCGAWIAAGARSMETHLWTGRYYRNYVEPETRSRSDLIFGFQLDGEWITDHHGLPSALPEDRVKTTLATIKAANIAVTKYGAVNYVAPDGTPAKVGGYGTYSYFPPEVLMLAMNFMYEGQREFGIELAHKAWHNIVCRQGYTWDMPNIMRGDVDTGERTYGNDYYQDMMLWSLPAALAGQDFGAPAQPGGLVDRINKAARR